MAKEDDLFADPAVSGGKPNRYEVDLSNIPTSPREINERETEDPEWNINATGVPRQQPQPREQPRSREEEFQGRPRGEQGGYRSEEFESRDGRPNRGRPDVDDRPNGRYQDSDDDEYTDDDDDMGDDKAPFKFSPKVLIPKFMELDNKKKAIVGGAALIAIIIIIVIISSIISSISEAVNQPTPVTSPSATSEPQESSTPDPVPPVETEWEAILSTTIGEAGVTIDGAEMVAESIKCDVDATDKNGTPVEAENGSWCRLEFSAKNVSSSVLTISSQRFVIFDISGETSYLGSTRYADVGGGNVIAKIAPQESVSGFVYFDVPTGTKVSEIQMSTFGNTGGSPIKVTVQSKEDVDEEPDPDGTATPTPTPAPEETSKPEDECILDALCD